MQFLLLSVARQNYFHFTVHPHFLSVLLIATSTALTKTMVTQTTRFEFISPGL